jgi:hypothetical protein
MKRSSCMSIVGLASRGNKPAARGVTLVANAMLAAMALCTSLPAVAAEEYVTVVELPGASVPDAEIDGAGTIHVAYLDGKNLYYVNSRDEGENFSPPMRVNKQPGFAAGGLFRGPDLAIGADQRVHIAWYNNAYRLKLPKSRRGFMYSRMRADHSGFEPERNLSNGPSDGFSLAANPQGEVAAVWVDEELFVAASDDGGASFGPRLSLTSEPCECCGTRTVFGQDGYLYYLYRDRQDNDRNMYLGRHGSPQGLGFPVKLNSGDWNINACPMSGSFLSHHDGSLFAAWELRGQIQVSMLDARGRKWPAGAITVSPDGRYPVILSNGSEILVAWKAGKTLAWRLFDLTGQTKGTVQSTETSRGGRRPAGVVTRRGQFLLFP